MSSQAQRKVILGLETTPGAGTTPTVALRATASLKAKIDKIVPDEDIGSFAPGRHYIGSLMAEGKLEMKDGYYEHAPYPLSMALGQGVKTGAADPWTYTWQLPDAVAPTFATYRMEYGDGNNHIVSANDVFAKGLEIKGEAGKGVSIVADLVGGSTTFPAALGASLTPLAIPTAIRMADTSLYMDDLFANIGVTAVGVLISFTWKLEDLQHQKLFAGSLYPTGRGNDKWKISLELILEVDQGTVETQKDKLLNTALTAIRVRSQASANDVLTIDGMYRLMEVGELDDRDGNNTIKFNYEAEKDSLGNLPSVIVKTNLSGL